MPDITHSITAQGVSGVIGLISFALAVLFWTGTRHHPRACVALVMTGTVGLLNTPPGHWARNLIDWINRMADQWGAHFLGFGLGFVFAIIVIYKLVERLFVQQQAFKRGAMGIDDRTLHYAALFPLTVTMIPGPIGHAIFVGLTWFTGWVGWVIGWCFHLN